MNVCMHNMCVCMYHILVVCMEYICVSVCTVYMYLLCICMYRVYLCMYVYTTYVTHTHMHTHGTGGLVDSGMFIYMLCFNPTPRNWGAAPASHEHPFFR